MKRTGYLFDQICSFANLYEAYRKAIRGSGKTDEACRFSFYLEKELLQLKRELECEDYRPAPLIFSLILPVQYGMKCLFQ